MLNRYLRFQDPKIPIVSALASFGLLIPLFLGRRGGAEEEEVKEKNWGG